MNTINTENKAADHIPEENRPQSSKWIKVGDLQPFPPIAKALPPKPEMVASIAEVMRTVGYDGSQPITTWRDQVVDGNTRLAAAKEAGLAKVPCVEMSFNSEDDALFYAISRQVQRRNLNDAEIARLFELLDKPVPRGGTPTRGSALSIAGKPAIAHSADCTAKALGISRDLVDNLRRILSKSPESFELLKEGGVTIKEVKAKIATSRQKTPKIKPVESIEASGIQPNNYLQQQNMLVRGHLERAHQSCGHDQGLAECIKDLFCMVQVDDSLEDTDSCAQNQAPHK